MSSGIGTKRRDPSGWKGLNSMAKSAKTSGRTNPLDAPTSLQEINSVTSQVRKVLETGNTMAAVINSFPEFADPQYQNTVDKVFRTKVGQEPSYNFDDRVVFKIEPPQGRWVPASTSLVMSVQVTKSDGTPTTDADFGPVNRFFFSLINQVKVLAIDGSTVPTNKSIDGVRDRCISDYLLDTRKPYREWIEQGMMYIDPVSKTIGVNADRLMKDNTVETSANLAERIRKFNKQLREPHEYRIPMSHIDPFFKINTSVDSNYQQQLQLIIEKNPNKLLESVKATTLLKRGDSPYKVKILGSPYLEHAVTKPTSIFLMLHSTILANKGSGTLVDFMDSERSITDIARVMQKQITLPQSVQQYSFLEIAIRAVNSDEHTSLYDTYDVDYARTVLRRIRIDRLFVDGAEESLSFDMQDKSDLNALYHNYLSLSSYSR